MIQNVGEQETTALIVVENFFEELKAKLGKCVTDPEYPLDRDTLASRRPIAGLRMVVACSCGSRETVRYHRLADSDGNTVGLVCYDPEV